MLLPEICGQNTGIASYDQSMFSPFYIASTPLILPVAWFTLIGLSVTLAKNVLSGLTGGRYRYVAAIYISTMLLRSSVLVISIPL
jgi:uncharacterized membrane protein